MQETKYRLTSKTDPTITKECTYTASDTNPNDGLAEGEANITFTDSEGNNYVFLKADVHVDGTENMSNPDWTVEKLPFDAPQA